MKYLHIILTMFLIINLGSVINSAYSAYISPYYILYLNQMANNTLYNNGGQYETYSERDRNLNGSLPVILPNIEFGPVDPSMNLFNLLSPFGLLGYGFGGNGIPGFGSLSLGFGWPGSGYGLGSFGLQGLGYGLGGLGFQGAGYGLGGLGFQGAGYGLGGNLSLPSGTLEVKEVYMVCDSWGNCFYFEDNNESESE